MCLCIWKCGVSSMHWLQKKKIFFRFKMGLILTNSEGLNLNTKSEFCYHVKVWRYRVSHNFMVSVTATENTRIIKQYKSRLFIICKRSDDIGDMLFLIYFIYMLLKKLTNSEHRKKHCKSTFPK